MGRDRREDEGQYYPGGKTIPVTPQRGGGSVVLDDTVTQNSQNGVKSSGIWSWVKSLLPAWLTPDYAEPATVASVNAKYAKPIGGIPLSDIAAEKFPPSTHTHGLSDINGLSTALAGKQSKITANGVLVGNGDGTVRPATQTDVAGLVVHQTIDHKRDKQDLNTYTATLCNWMLFGNTELIAHPGIGSESTYWRSSDNRYDLLFKTDDTPSGLPSWLLVDWNSGEPAYSLQHTENVTDLDLVLLNGQIITGAASRPAIYSYTATGSLAKTSDFGLNEQGSPVTEFVAALFAPAATSGHLKNAALEAAIRLIGGGGGGGGGDEKMQAVFVALARMDAFTATSEESDPLDVAITKLSQLLGEDIAA